jgi:RNA polymerase sigma factor (sigma-70 family)
MIGSIETRVMTTTRESTDANREVVASLLDARGHELWGYARHLGLSPEEASDAVQEALLRLWSALGSGDPVREPAAWAFRTLQRICVDEHRWRRRVRALGERLRLYGNVDPVQAGPADDAGIWSVVEQLPERQRLAIYLRYRADLAYADIAAVLGIEPASARSHVSRGLDALRTQLSEEMDR